MPKQQQFTPKQHPIAIAGEVQIRSEPRSTHKRKNTSAFIFQHKNAKNLKKRLQSRTVAKKFTTLWTLLKPVLAFSPWNSFKGAAAVTLVETAAETAIAAIIFFLRGKEKQKKIHKKKHCAIDSNKQLQVRRNVQRNTKSLREFASDCSSARS